MSDRIVTPGYVWSEINPLFANNIDVPERVIGEIDLRARFPIFGLSNMQRRWDSRVEGEHTDEYLGTCIRHVTLNPDAEEGDILWFPGWGVENQRGGGARMLVALAMMNPNRTVTAFEEIEGMRNVIERVDRPDRLHIYSQLYIDSVEKLLAGKKRDSRRTLHVSGQSRGGLITSYMAYLEAVEVQKLPKINGINLIDTTMLTKQLSAIIFAAKVGGFDNLVQKKYVDQVDVLEESLLNTVDIDEPVNTGPREALAKARDQWWLIDLMAQGGLESILRPLVVRGVTDVDIWHGTANVGIKAAHMRPIVSSLAIAKANSDAESNLRYFEAPTGHYSEGHTARYARQTTHALERFYARAA